MEKKERIEKMLAMAMEHARGNPGWIPAAAPLFFKGWRIPDGLAIQACRKADREREAVRVRKAVAGRRDLPRGHAAPVGQGLSRCAALDAAKRVRVAA